MDRRSTSARSVAFDLLYLNGYDLRKLPLVDRIALLKRLIAKTDVQFSESFEVDGPDLFKHACGIWLEGVVSKVRDRDTPLERGNVWVKKTGTSTGEHRSVFATVSDTETKHLRCRAAHSTRQRTCEQRTGKLSRFMYRSIFSKSECSFRHTQRTDNRLNNLSPSD